MKIISGFNLIVIFVFLTSCQVMVRQPSFAVSLSAPFTSNVRAQEQEQEEIENTNFVGFGVSKKTGQVIEVTSNGDIILNRFGTSSPIIFEKNKVEIASESQEIIKLILNGTIVKFQKPAQINPQDLTGKWFAYTNEDGYERSRIISYEDDGYYYESIELFHYDQSYSQYSQFYPYRFTKGFVFEDYFDETESYWYFLVEANGSKMTYVDEDGTSWVEEKYTGQPHLEIPTYYFDESF